MDYLLTDYIYHNHNMDIFELKAAVCANGISECQDMQTLCGWVEKKLL